jgi:uncharacterized lipoprotein YddW (UPF0748 family)
VKSDLISLVRRCELVVVPLAMFVLLSSCAQTPTVVNSMMTRCDSVEASTCGPASPREFRAAWIATVANIDWPSSSALSVAEQKSEIVAIVNRAADLNLNALILQVRPSADAIYPSSLEPWSEFVTGEQGRAPVPAYDPLRVWIDESHRRGIELHAWFNPYRARHARAKSPNSAGHVTMKQPQIVRNYGANQWLDPGEPAAAKQTLDVIMDVLRRYDVDGIHIDDYFYPYPIKASEMIKPPESGSVVTSPPPVDREIDFPDEPSWRKYVSAGGRLARADWRRQNVNQLVERIYTDVKQTKPWVKFGISPFGVGKPDRRPPGISGFSQYDKLYADVELWMQKGWFDYLVPQLYWPIDQRAQAFVPLLDYWHRENVARRHVFPGLYTSRIDDTEQSWQPTEIVNQIEITRARSEPAGHAHYSMIAIMQNRKGVADQLQRLYPLPALMPSAAWVSSTRASPMVSRIEVATPADNQRRELAITIARDLGAEDAKNIALWLRYGSQWQFAVVPIVPSVATTEPSSVATSVANATRDGALNAVVAAAVDRYAREGPRVLQTVVDGAR